MYVVQARDANKQVTNFQRNSIVDLVNVPQLHLTDACDKKELEFGEYVSDCFC